MGELFACKECNTSEEQLSSTCKITGSKNNQIALTKRRDNTISTPSKDSDHFQLSQRKERNHNSRR